MTSGPALAYIRPDDPADTFPPVARALEEPNGLLAVGGDLSVERLLCAYRRGIFPWYSEGEPILWWSPDPRCVFFPDAVHISRRLARTLKQQHFTLSVDRAFDAVIQACAEPRHDKHGHNAGSWLLPEMQAAYLALHEAGHAHSFEVWRDSKLIGGLYGVAAGTVFSAESMFSRETDASKIALVHLSKWVRESGYELIDAQVGSPHLYRMGAVDISRRLFSQHLKTQPVLVAIE